MGKAYPGYVVGLGRRRGRPVQVVHDGLDGLNRLHAKGDGPLDCRLGEAGQQRVQKAVFGALGDGAAERAYRGEEAEGAGEDVFGGVQVSVEDAEKRIAQGEEARLSAPISKIVSCHYSQLKVVCSVAGVDYGGRQRVTGVSVQLERALSRLGAQHVPVSLVGGWC